MKTIASIGTALACLVAPLVGQERIEQRRPAARDGTVKITSHAGTVRVFGWERDSVAISGTLGPGIRRVEFVTAAPSTQIRLVADPEALRGAKDPTADLMSEVEVRVPSGSYVAIRTTAAAIEVSGVWGALDLESETGSVHVGPGGMRSVYVETAGGDIVIDGATKILRAKAVDGTVRVNRAMGFVEVSSVSGDVTVRGRGLSHGDVTTVSGNIDFEGSLEQGAPTFSFETHSGTIELRLPADVGADFDVTTLQGRFENQFGASDVTTFSTGGGGPLVRIKTFKGLVRLLRLP